MRLHKQIRALIGRSATAGVMALLFAFGIPMSVFGQTTPGAAAPAANPPQTAGKPQLPPEIANGTPLTIEDAVKMALENNLGVQAARLNTEVQTWSLARANSAFAPTLISTFSHNNSAAPPTDFLSSGVAVVTSGNLYSNAGVAQQLRWGGGNYALTFDGSRSTTDAPRTAYPLALQSHLNASFTQPLIKNFRTDANRTSVLQSKLTQSITDLQVTQQVTQMARTVRAAYFNLIGAISGLHVAQESLDLAKQSLHDNQMRVEAGTMAKIDLVTSEAEVASNEGGVISQEAAIQSAEDQLRVLLLNPSQTGYWTTVFNPTDQPTNSPRAIDVDAAVKNALENRTDILQLKKQIENTDVGLKLAQNQKLPEVDLVAKYGATGIGGTQYQFDPTGLTPGVIGTSVRNFSSVLGDVLNNNFRNWTVAVNFSYPLGTSNADAQAAQTRVQQRQNQLSLHDLEANVTAAVRDSARTVTTNLKLVEATRKAADLAQQRLDAEQKRFNVGLGTQLELLQAQRDLSTANQQELQAMINYNVALVNFDAIQTVPVNGR
jgi:outer membrane protein TolC